MERCIPGHLALTKALGQVLQQRAQQQRLVLAAQVHRVDGQGFGLHVWLANTQSPAERLAWVAQLDEMAALKPQVVVPGHMKTGTPLDASTLRFTRDYLQAFDQAATASANSAELIGRMKAVYPDAVGGLSSDIGAKVSKGEMTW